MFLIVDIQYENGKNVASIKRFRTKTEYLRCTFKQIDLHPRLYTATSTKSGDDAIRKLASTIPVEVSRQCVVRGNFEPLIDYNG